MRFGPPRDEYCASAATTSQSVAEDIWFPYPYSGLAQLSLFNKVIAYERQLAKLAWQAELTIDQPIANAVPDDGNATLVAYDKLETWSTGAVQGFLLNRTRLPSVFFLE